MAEQYLNIAKTTVSNGGSGYSSGAGSLKVASTSAGTVTGYTGNFPSSGTFTVTILDAATQTTIKAQLTVTAVTNSTTWAVSGEINGSANDGDIVVACWWSARAIDQIRSDICKVGTYANLPASGMKAGDRYRQTDGPFEYVYDGSSWRRFFPTYGESLIPTTSGFAAAGSNTSSLHSYTTKGRHRLYHDGTTGDTFWRPTSTNVPASNDFRFRVLLRASKHAFTDDVRLGIFLEDTSNSKAVSLSVSGNQHTYFHYWTNVTTPTLSSTKMDNNRATTGLLATMMGGPFWIGLLYRSGGNFDLTFAGFDGAWHSENNYSVTDFLAARPTRAGLYFGMHSTFSVPAAVEILTFEFEQGTNPTNFWEDFT